MERLVIAPSGIPFFPTRRSPPKQWKLDSLETAFARGELNTLPEVIIFEREKCDLVADGNHRILLAMKYNQRLNGIKLARGEEFVLIGEPTLNYGKHKTYIYQNFGVYGAYIEWCRLVAVHRGYKTFRELYERHMGMIDKL